ncbi:hypothetical protein EVAR_100731_1 [Eumeta japonica]|uniref:Uncharacterized protein n=1 Tax=Eumeta variegata TaxID=151549 RepID=A0A4C2AED4_EUMVA|nr:hypothetical protein EVAR_100731_1 [Eumeta japonica]
MVRAGEAPCASSSVVGGGGDGRIGTGERSWKRRHKPRVQQRRATARSYPAEAEAPAPGGTRCRPPSSMSTEQKNGWRPAYGDVSTKVSKYPDGIQT